MNRRTPPFLVPALAMATASAAQQGDRERRLAERAHEDREIVYLLLQPETHSFELYHDYTEGRPGVGRYLNVVREGSHVSDPSARVLDTGAVLVTRTLRGAAISEAGIDIERPVTPEAEVVVVDFEAPGEGESIRLRIRETYTDPGRYALEGETLVWDRRFGRMFNAVVLPEGWFLTGSSIPAVISEMADGRIRLDFTNPRPDAIDVLITARRRGTRAADAQ